MHRHSPVALALLATLSAPGLAAQRPDVQDDGAGLLRAGPPVWKPVTLPTSRAARTKLEAARDYLAGARWAEAARLIQGLLDSPEDGFLPPDDGKDGPRRAGVRATAARLLDEMPPAGIEFYRLAHDAAAARLLADARKRNDPAALAEAARRYAHTRSGPEALTLLGTWHLDRGHAPFAAHCFARLLRLPGADRLPPETLLRAALAFEQSGDARGAADAWDRLSRAAPGGLVRVGGQAVAFDRLREAAARSAPPAVGDPALFRGDAGRNGAGGVGVPLLEPVVEIPLAGTAESRGWLRQIAEGGPELRQLSGAEFTPPMPLAGGVPVAAGGLLVFRDYGGLRAVDAATGRPAWSAPSPLSLDSAARDPDKGRLVQLRNWLRKSGPARGLLVENSTLGTLSTDGVRVYAVEDLPLPPPGAAAPQQPDARPLFGPRGDAVFHNRLRALDLTSGGLVWESGGRAGRRARAATGLEDGFFLGPPLPLGGVLYALVERRQEVTLVGLRPETGEVLWSQELAAAPEPRPAPERRTHALHPAYGEGVLVCPTHAGAVVGVDPFSRDLLWAHVYHERRPTPATPPELDPAERVPVAAPAAWDGCAPVVAAGRVLFTAPDSEAVHCLDPRDGSLLWKAPAATDDLYLAGVRGGRVLVVGSNFCRALDLATGRTLWRQPTGGAPSGLGVFCGSRYFVPLRRGAVLALDLDRPECSTVHDCRGGGAPGNLVFCGETLWSQDGLTLTAYPPLVGRLKRADRAVARKPRDPAARYERGRLRRDAGDASGAAADLRAALADGPDDALAPRVRAAYYAALTDLLRRDFPAGERYLDDYRRLGEVAAPAAANAEEQQRMESEGRRRRLGYLALLGRGRVGQGRLEDAVRAYAELAAAPAAGERLADPDDPAVRVRPDLWAATRVAALAARLNPEKRGRLRALAEAEWPAARDGDAPALERFLVCYAPFAADSGEAARLRLVERLGREADDPLPAVLRLHALEEERSTPAVAAAALTARARLLTRAGDLDGALACYRRLARDFPAAAAAAEPLSDKRFLPLLEEADPRWEQGRMKAEKIPGKYGAAPSSFGRDLGDQVQPAFRRLRIEIDAKAARLRILDRETGAESWGASFPPDPVSESPPPLLPGVKRVDEPELNLSAGYVAAGPSAAVDLGWRCVGLDLLGRRVRWAHSADDDAGAVGPWVVQLLEDVAIAPGALRRLPADVRARSWGSLLPVAGPTAVYSQGHGRLAALDPATGLVRWARADLGPNLDAFGDRDHLFVADLYPTGELRAFRAFRARDGVTVSVPDSADAYAHKLRALGGRLLVLDRPDAGRGTLRLYDLPTGKDFWRHPVPPRAVVLDSPHSGLTGLVLPDGGVTVLDAETGRELLRAELPRAEVANLHSAHVLRDRERFYVALETEPVPQAGEDSGNFSDLPSVPVSGMLYALRPDGKVHWFARLPRQAILTERFEELPVVIASVIRVGSEAKQPTPESTAFTRVFDKRTGKLLLRQESSGNPEPFHTLRIDPRARTVDLLGPAVKLRFTCSERGG